jgi:hypothetical protein
LQLDYRIGDHCHDFMRNEYSGARMTSVDASAMTIVFHSFFERTAPSRWQQSESVSSLRVL